MELITKEEKPILASVEVVKEVKRHPNADTLDICKVLGYSIITKLGDYKVGDKVCLIYPDSILPDEPWTAFYKAKSSRIKAIKLRNEWSQGVIESGKNTGVNLENFAEGDNITDILKIVKYEAPEPQDLSAKGGLPFGIVKTDETNFEKLRNGPPYGEIVDINLKIDGKSATFYCKVEDKKCIQKGITGRTLEMKLECDNHFTKMEKKYDGILGILEHYCINHNVSIALRGELYGVGIQNFKINPHVKLPVDIGFYSVYLIDSHEYARKGNEHYLDNIIPFLQLPRVPLLEKDVLLTHDIIEKYSDILTEINGKPFEGVVVQHRHGSFKIINKYYDSKK